MEINLKVMPNFPVLFRAQTNKNVDGEIGELK